MVTAQLFARMEQDLGLSAPLSVLYEASTPRQLAGKLSGGTVPRNWKSLVPINPSGNRPPLFLVHGGGGNVLMFRDLGRLLSPDYPLYALQAQGMDGSKKYVRSVEEMAAKYLAEILDLQPTGPYHLGGFCMGAHVAFEIAQRLRRSGQQVNLLMAIDSYNFNGVALEHTLIERIRHAMQKVSFHLSNVTQLGLKGQRLYLTDKLKIAIAREIARFSVKMSDLLGLNRGGPREEFIEDINDRAMFAYMPCVYPGKMTLFKPQQNYAFMRDPFNGWHQVAAGGLEVFELPVDPGGIFIKPYVQILADKIKGLIDAASKNAAPSPAVPDAGDAFGQHPGSPSDDADKLTPNFLTK
jgi:thioesterase domain-containing protein